MTARQPARFRQALQAALAQLNAGKLAQAEKAGHELSRLAPDDPAVLQLQATIALRLGKPAEAWQAICRALRSRPGHVPSLVLAGRVAREVGALEAAVTHLREAVKRAPDQAEPAFLLCRTLLELNDPAFDAAFTWTGEKHPREAGAWQQLGVALQSRQRPLAALTSFTRAVAADPAAAGAHFGSGLLLREVGRMEEAKAALEAAVALNPTASAAWFALGLTRQDLDDEFGAVVAFRTALAERSDFAEAAVNLGIALQRVGDLPAAMHAYRTAVAIRPDTYSRIAQAVTAASTGMLWLSPDDFRRALA